MVAPKNGTTVLLRWVLGIVAMVIGTAFTTLVVVIRNQAVDIMQLQLFRARTEADRFTIGDAVRWRVEIEANIPPPEVVRRLDALERRQEGN